MGMASLVLGIISLVGMFLSLVSNISFGAIPSICAIVGLILGIMDNKKEKNNKATTGIVLCLLYMIIFIIIVIQSIMSLRSFLA